MTNATERYAKQIIVVRKDLGMSRGKMAIQATHAAKAVLLNLMEVSEDEDEFGKVQDWVMPVRHGSALYAWLNGAFTGVCVYVNSEEELLEVYDNAVKAGLPVSLIKDAGKTEFGGVPTITCIGVGPAWSDELHPITGHLPVSEKSK